MKDRAKINSSLMKRGLASLDDARNLLPQIAFNLKTERHFMMLLGKVPMEKKRACYESLKPYLHFTAKTLDHYIARMNEEVEKRQLPTLDAKGEIVPYQPAEIGLRKRATEAIHDGAAWEKTHRSLTLTCGKCTRTNEFFGESMVDAVTIARKAGWMFDKHDGKEREICPKCPAVRSNVN